MSYYQFNRQKILQKAKKNYSKGKAAKYYIATKEASKKKTKNRYKNMTDKKKTSTKRISKKYYKKLKPYKDELFLEKKNVAKYYKK